MGGRSTTGSALRAVPTDTQPDAGTGPLAEVVRMPSPRAASSPRYRILGSIHRGGMGEILLARVEGPDGFSRKVVLKGLLSRLSEDDVSFQLFMREARLMACLDHPNVVRVFDLPVLDGKPFLAMEYLRGRNFHQVIQRAGARFGAVPPRIALSVVAGALRGLHHAHSARDEDGRPLDVIHRDVSPGNVLVSFFGEVKVTDFGIATLANAPRFTGPRSIRGKARYVAPEQVHGEAAAVTSDLYSAGVVLAEALLGEPLWERGAVPETLLAIVSEDREVTLDRILKAHPRIAGLKAALRGALALNPRDRFVSALQFAETLEAIAQPLGGVASQVELGMFLRELFADSPDVPQDDGFGASGFPVPRFGMDDDETGSTATGEVPEVAETGPGATARIRPRDPREATAEAAPVAQPMQPIETGASARVPGTMLDEEALLEALIRDLGQGDAAERAPSVAAASLPAAATPTSAILDPEQPPIRAGSVSAESALLLDPAEPRGSRHATTDREDPTELPEADPTAPLPPQAAALRAPAPLPAREAMPPRGELSVAERSLTLLVTGIFIGAALSLAGGVVALVFGR